ncbi:Cof-type HAD-IIB family hydrolase [Paenibacillus wynnii]|uniref:Cof-type HAD-IIB family hydrolase n=1 Tax=Paenibacillus wynnii TaxID=268407 RepID=UPI00278D202D|nr:Cof-type HAD-IIB family hydrolase [Paenibacillus wynnii]MDQ0196840.1 Cof subfamily protein (haloacid dehalogenase superfamily) [Paenibacillus wynnii]
MLIALDMDGTLLNEDGVISPGNREAIVQAQSLGHIVAIASGRSYMDAERQLRLADLQCPVVSLNGAAAALPGGMIVASRPLDKEDLLPVLRWMNEIPELYYEIYTEDNVYVELNKRVRLEKLASMEAGEVPENVRWIIKLLVEKQFQQAAVTYVEHMDEIWSKKENVIYKALAFSFNLDLLKEASTRFASIPGLIITSSHENNLEINHHEATKGHGVTLLASHFGIAMEDVAVMGDSYNDLPMFKVAGHRIAMANAAPILKEMSDYITFSNNEDGVAEGIRYLLKK